MEKKRVRLYKELEIKIGRTPLVRYSGEVPNNNVILIKRECDNPYGSHYDRVYLELFRHFESEGKLIPGMNVLETTSGTAGVSFAGIGKFLGFNCYVMIPDDSYKKKRIEVIEFQGGNVILTPGEEDVFGFTKDRIFENIREYNAFFLNHSFGKRGTNNEVTLSALETIAREVSEVTEVDVYVCGIGNGSSVVGLGRFFRIRNPNINIVGYKPQKVGKSDFPGLMNQDGLDRKISFPHLVEANSLMSKVVLIDDWDGIGYEDLGRSAVAGINVGLKIAEEISNKNILVLGYDKIQRY